ASQSMIQMRAPSWRELAGALAAAVAVVAIGMLYTHGWLLPATSTRRPALDAVNQLLIYAPFLLLLVLRGQRLETAWLPTRGVASRVAIGLALALLALLTYAAVRPGLGAWPRLVTEVYAPDHISYLVQVLLEDISLAIVFVRLRGAIGRWTIVIVATLFAAAHIPGMLSGGADASALWHLLGDVALGVLALTLLQRLRDVWWFWMVHFALDMTQFFAG
ncbi:MAG TPA: CPBP family glutamic-type intramembrane protease, partial [Kofleriaceae bacterium]